MTTVTDAPQPPAIQQLSDDIANKIAAGEVIERPAAVIKELVENCIDAGATHISIRSVAGGHQVLEVCDNGHGMQPDDLHMALRRHATSKIQSADDLFHIASLGFRGEALASIAGVSEFEIASRPHQADSGHNLRMMGSKEAGSGTCAMAPGTRVSVRNLFWNVPARLKFLKSEASETGHITDQVQRLALSHPHISFTLHNGERCIFDLPQHDNIEQRIHELFGKECSEHLLPISVGSDCIEISGFVTHPSQARARAKKQFVFLNGRFIKDKLIIAAIREGYRGFLEPRLHPPVFLYIDIDPSLVDVNVHPCKSEVRFRNDREIFGLVKKCIHEAVSDNAGGFQLLSQSNTANTLAPTTSSQTHGDILSRTVVKSAEAPLIQERFIPQNSPVGKGVNEHQDFYRVGNGINTNPSDSAHVDSNIDSSAANNQIPDAHVHMMNSTSTATSAHSSSQSSAQSSSMQIDGLPGIKRIVQLHDMYLLIETDNGIRLVDQHALHEKAIFLSLDPNVTNFEGSGRQELLIPQSIELSAAETAVVEPLLPSLQEHGIEAEMFGPCTLLLRAHPMALKKVNWTSFFAEMAAEGSKDYSIKNIRRRIAHSASCHRAVKAGDILLPSEQENLVRLLYTLEHMEHCPHGRPTTLDLSWGELERRFQR